MDTDLTLSHEQFCLSNEAPHLGFFWGFLASLQPGADVLPLSSSLWEAVSCIFCKSACPRPGLPQSISNDPLFSGHPEPCWTSWFKPWSPVPTGYSKGIYEKSCLEAGRGKNWVMWAAWSRGCMWCITRHPPQGKAGSWGLLPGPTEPQWAPFTNPHHPMA